MKCLNGGFKGIVKLLEKVRNEICFALVGEKKTCLPRQVRNFFCPFNVYP